MLVQRGAHTAVIAELADLLEQQRPSLIGELRALARLPQVEGGSIGGGPVLVLDLLQVSAATELQAIQDSHGVLQCRVRMARGGSRRLAFAAGEGWNAVNHD